MNEKKQIRNIACLALAKTIGPLSYLDVGAAAGPNHEAIGYLLRHDALNFFGLEPDESQIEILKRNYPNAKFIPHAVFNKNEARKLYITAVGGCSSLLEPNLDFLNEYPIRTWMKIEKIVDIQVTTIEDLINKKNIPIPDFIKLDIQGTEYEALEGMGEFLNNLTGIELETTLKPVYKNQKTFDEIFKFLDSKGFALRDIQHQGPFEGELIELNAFFSKKPSDPTTNIYKLKLWEFISEIESPPHLAQIQLQSNMQNHELWSEITEFHKSRLFGEL